MASSSYVMWTAVLPPCARSVRLGRPYHLYTDSAVPDCAGRAERSVACGAPSQFTAPYLVLPHRERQRVGPSSTGRTSVQAPGSDSLTLAVRIAPAWACQLLGACGQAP